jgi:hypothetical protein
VRRLALAGAVAVLLAAGATRAADFIAPYNYRAAGNQIDGIHDPTTSQDPTTAAVRLGDLTPAGAPCILEAPGANGLPVCSSLSGFTAHAPLLLTGADLTLTLDGVTVTNSGGAVQRMAIGGVVNVGAGSAISTYPTVGALSVLVNATNGSAAPSFLGPGSNGTRLGIASGAIAWTAVAWGELTGIPTFATIATSGSASDLIAGTVPCGRQPAETGDVVTSGCGATIQPNVVTTAKMQQFAALSLIGVAGGSMANAAAITCGGDGQVFWDNAGNVVCAALPYSKLTGAPTLFNQTIESAGTPLTQRPILNFGSEFGTVDNSGASRTDVTIATITSTKITSSANGIGYFNSSGQLTDDPTNFSWDDANHRAVIGTGPVLAFTHAQSPALVVNPNTTTVGSSTGGFSAFFGTGTGPSDATGWVFQQAVNNSTGSVTLVETALGPNSSSTNHTTINRGFTRGGFDLTGFTYESMTSAINGSFDLFHGWASSKYSFRGATGLATPSTTPDWTLFEVNTSNASGLAQLITTLPLDAIVFRASAPIQSFASQSNSTSTGFNFYAIYPPTFETSLGTTLGITNSATLVIYGVPAVNSGGSFGTTTVTNAYGFWVEGANTTTSARFDGGVLINGQASTALQISSFGAGHLQTNGSGNVSVDTTTYLTAPVALANLALCSTGQVVGMVAGVQGCVTPSSPGVGTVTDVTGQTGQVNVVNNTSTPAISLQTKGAGAGGYGGSGIAGFTLDSYGAVLSVTPATFLTSTGTTPGTYNELTVASTGLIVGNSNTSWASTVGAVLVGAGLSAVPTGFANFKFASNVLTIGDGTTATFAAMVSSSGNPANWEFYKDATPTKGASVGVGVPGGSATNDLLFSTYDGTSWTERGRFINGGSLEIASLTTGLVMSASSVLQNATPSDIAAFQVWPATTDVLASSGTGSAPVGDPNITIDIGTHTFTSNHATVLGGSIDFVSFGGAGEVLMGVANSGSGEDVFATGGISLSSGVLQGVVFGASGGSHAIGMVPDPGSVAAHSRVLNEDATWGNAPRTVTFDTTITNPTVGGYLSTSTNIGFAAAIANSRYPLGVAARRARLMIYVTSNSLTYSGLMTFSIYLNGTNLGCSVGAATSSGSTPTGTLLDTGICTALGTTATTDSWAVALNSTGTYAGGAISFTAVLTTDP